MYLCIVKPKSKHLMNQALEKGTVLQGAANRYTIVRTLGQGSFGITYLATMQVQGPLGAIEVEVAVKEFFMREINSRDGSVVTGGGTTRDGLFQRYRQKFRHEAQSLSRMQHPGIVRVVEAFDTNNTSYIAMEYLGGGSLDDLIPPQGLPEAEALRYIRAIGQALAYMHDHQMLHLDLKPSNIMLNRQGEPVIIDFGLSKHYDDSGNPESSTTVGAGTPGYAPIEQASYRDGKTFPVTIDVYALGATLFKLLCGHRPPEAPDLFTEGFPYADLQHIDKTTVNAVAKAMAPNKNDRYPSVPAFLTALGAATPSVDSEATTFDDEKTTVDMVPEALATSPASYSEGETPKMEDKKQKPKKKVLLWLLLFLLAIAAVVAVVALGRNADGDPPVVADSTPNDTIIPVDISVGATPVAEPTETAPTKDIPVDISVGATPVVEPTKTVPTKDIPSKFNKSTEVSNKQAVNSTETSPTKKINKSTEVSKTLAVNSTETSSTKDIPSKVKKSQEVSKTQTVNSTETSPTKKVNKSTEVSKTQATEVMKKREIPVGYVDLGLPSGTLWKNSNEPGGLYSYDEAKKKFGSRLPTLDQFEELRHKCRWEWIGDGCRVTGPNGNSIVLSASGHRFAGSVSGVGSSGNYWSSTRDDSRFAWNLYFNSGEARMGLDYRSNGYTVRLIQN